MPVEFKQIIIQDYMVIVQNEAGFYGQYSMEGEKILPCEYESIEFHGSLNEGQGYSRTVKNGLKGIVSENGKKIIPNKNKRVKKVESGYIVCNMGDKDLECQGWYSKDGKYKIPCDYQKLNFHDMFIEAIEWNGPSTFYTYNGKKIELRDDEKGYCIGNFVIAVIGKDHITVYDRDNNILFEKKASTEE